MGTRIWYIWNKTKIIIQWTTILSHTVYSNIHNSTIDFNINYFYHSLQYVVKPNMTKAYVVIL